MEKEYLMSGDLLKKIRKSLGFKQSEIVGKEATRNLISLIENNKASLNDNIMDIIIKNMNRLSEERSFDVVIEKKDLLIPGIFEAKKTADNYYKNLSAIEDKADLDPYAEEINMFFSKWDLPKKKANTYLKLADLYFSRNLLYNSYIYYNKSFESMIRLSDYTSIIELIKKVTHLCIRLQKYKECIEFAKISSIYKNDVSQDIYISILYHKALAYLYLKEYNLCFEQIDSIKELIEDTKAFPYFEIMILKAICFKRIGRLNESLEIYFNLKDNLPSVSSEKTLMILLNIIEILCIQEDKPKVTEYLKLAVPLVEKLESNSVYLARFNLEIALAYKFLDNYILSENYLNTALICAKHIKDLDSISRIINTFTDIYIALEKLSSLDIFVNEIEYLFQNNLITQDNKSIFRLMSFYNKRNKSEKVDLLIKLFINKGETKDEF